MDIDIKTWLYDILNAINEIENKLNNRPRKTLGFYNPLQTLNAFYQLTNSCT